MGGVNKVDQQPHYQHTLRKSYRWYHKLALWLISQVILNAHKIYLGHTGSNIVFLDFIHNTIASLLASTPKIIIPDVHIPGDTYAHLTGRHFPQVKKSDQWPTTNVPTTNVPVTNNQPNNVMFAIPVDFAQTKANHWKPFTFVICDLQSQGCIQITALECIIQCLIILGNDFPFYSYNCFWHTNMPKHTSMLKTILWVQGNVIYYFTLYSLVFSILACFWHLYIESHYAKMHS